MFPKTFICRDVVRLLLQYEASTNVVDAKGSSPLHLAAWAGDAEIVRLILNQGPSVPKVNLAVSSIMSILRKLYDRTCKMITLVHSKNL